MGTKSSKFDELFSGLPQNDNTHVYIIGLKNAGKSTILSRMQLRTRTKNIRALGISIVKPRRHVCITVCDMAALGRISQIQGQHFPGAKGIVLVIDCTDEKDIKEAGVQLTLLLKSKQLKMVPLMVMANKKDLPETMDISKISCELCLCNLNRMWDIIETSGKTGDGVYEAMQGLVDMIKHGGI